MLCLGLQHGQLKFVMHLVGTLHIVFILSISMLVHKICIYIFYFTCEFTCFCQWIQWHDTASSAKSSPVSCELHRTGCCLCIGHRFRDGRIYPIISRVFFIQKCCHHTLPLHAYFLPCTCLRIFVLELWSQIVPKLAVKMRLSLFTSFALATQTWSTFLLNLPTPKIQK